MFPFGKFPYNKYMEQFLSSMNTNDMDEYAKKIMSSAFSGSMSDFFKQQDAWKPMHGQKLDSSSRTLNSHVLETLDDCIIQIKVPDKSMLQQLKVFHTPYECIIEWFDEKPQQEKIRLPHSVRRKGTKAIYRNGILEIKLPKSPHIAMSEIDVHDHD